VFFFFFSNLLIFELIQRDWLCITTKQTLRIALKHQNSIKKENERNEKNENETKEQKHRKRKEKERKRSR